MIMVNSASALTVQNFEFYDKITKRAVSSLVALGDLCVCLVQYV